MRKRTVLGQVLVLAVLALASRAEAQVSFYIDGGKKVTSVEQGAATELNVKAKIPKKKRSKKFNSINIHLEFEGNTGFAELMAVEDPKEFLTRFKGDDVTVSIVKASGEAGDILTNKKTPVTFDDLVETALIEKRTTNKIKVSIKGWKVAGYTTERVWKEGEQKWVNEKSPKWAETVLATGTLQITNIAPSQKQMLGADAKKAYYAGEYQKVIDLGNQAIEAGVAAGAEDDVYFYAAFAACNLKDKASAPVFYKYVTNEQSKATLKQSCKWVVKLEP